VHAGHDSTGSLSHKIEGDAILCHPLKPGARIRFTARLFEPGVGLGQACTERRRTAGSGGDVPFYLAQALRLWRFPIKPWMAP